MQVCADFEPQYKPQYILHINRLFFFIQLLWQQCFHISNRCLQCFGTILSEAPVHGQCKVYIIYVTYTDTFFTCAIITGQTLLVQF